ncbi:MAG: hypothetical protein NTX87_06935 [Planctomycetota bacterium]|nr:hypothetical protein [Planctomycetota bacterium]
MRPILLLSVALMAVALLAGGCGEAATRAWQRAELPTHDWPRAFDAARDVLKEHFEIADASMTAGTLETKPQVLDRARSGTLADLRGAGGRWRQTVSVELDRGGLAIGARVAVRLEREATAAAVAITESGANEPRVAESGARAQRPVWVEVGYDAPLAREILVQIADRVRKMEQGEMPSMGQSPKEALEETRRIGAEQGR